MFKGHSRPLFWLVLVTLTNMCGSKAQTSPRSAVAEPQYINVFVAVDASEKLTELDHQNVTTFRSKIKALPGYATVKVLAEIKPAHASVRLAGGAQFGSSSEETAELVKSITQRAEESLRNT